MAQEAVKDVLECSSCFHLFYSYIFTFCALVTIRYLSAYLIRTVVKYQSSIETNIWDAVLAIIWLVIPPALLVCDLWIHKQDTHTTHRSNLNEEKAQSIISFSNTSLCDVILQDQCTPKSADFPESKKFNVLYRVEFKLHLKNIPKLNNSTWDRTSRMCCASVCWYCTLREQKKFNVQTYQRGTSNVK